MIDIYKYKNYQKYLNDYCQTERGLLSKLAEAADCQKSYLSACLKQKCHLTIDHIFGISEYLKLNEIEQDYLFLMVNKDRASKYQLQRKFEQKMQEIAREQSRIKNTQKSSIIIEDTQNNMGLYYSNWLFVAIHSLTSIKKYQTAIKISDRLFMPKNIVQDCLNKLEKLELVKKEGDNYKWNSHDMHLDDTSLWNNLNHANWRFCALNNLQKNDKDTIHYTVTQSMSVDDYNFLKNKISNFIKEFHKTSDPSEPEESYNLIIDFFKI